MEEGLKGTGLIMAAFGRLAICLSTPEVDDGVSVVIPRATSDLMLSPPCQKLSDSGTDIYLPPSDVSVTRTSEFTVYRSHEYDVA